MSTIASCNYAFQDPPLHDGDIVHGGTFIQALPGTEIAKGVKVLTIEGGNWINVKPQPTWVIKGGNWAQKDFSPKKHAEWVKAGHLAADPKDLEDVKHRSKAKQWKEIQDHDYKKFVDDGDAATMVAAGILRIGTKVKDESGLTEQRAEVLEYDYEDIDLGRASFGVGQMGTP